MEGTTTFCPLAVTLAQQLRASKDELTTLWLERIAARVNLDANSIFPTEELLDHAPLLIVGIADYLEKPTEDITTDVPVVAKGRELGALRYAQGFDAYEILKEFELLGGVLFARLTHLVDGIDEPCSRSELLQCTHRIFRAIEVIQQATTNHFLELSNQKVREREERLRGFNRMVSHELKNRVGAILGAHAMLVEPFLKDGERHRFLDMVAENAEGIKVLLENLVSLSRLDSDARQQRNILLAQASAEAVRQLREFARARGVAVRIADDLPLIEVNAAAVELCLSNYVSNAIKYSDPAKADRRVAISAHLESAEGDPQMQHGGSGDRRLVVEVSDNGLGLPEPAHAQLFQRFFRAHADTISEVEGTGLGLSIVRETVEGLGGSAWATPNATGGMTFAFSLPCRRELDAAT